MIHPSRYTTCCDVLGRIEGVPFVSQISMLGAMLSAAGSCWHRLHWLNLSRHQQPHPSREDALLFVVFVCAWALIALVHTVDVCGQKLDHGKTEMQVKGLQTHLGASILCYLQSPYTAAACCQQPNSSHDVLQGKGLQTDLVPWRSAIFTAHTQQMLVVRQLTAVMMCCRSKVYRLIWSLSGLPSREPAPCVVATPAARCRHLLTAGWPECCTAVSTARLVPCRGIRCCRLQTVRRYRRP